LSTKKYKNIKNVYRRLPCRYMRGDGEAGIGGCGLAISPRTKSSRCAVHANEAWSFRRASCSGGIECRRISVFDLRIRKHAGGRDMKMAARLGWSIGTENVLPKVGSNIL
jgi:hypothetical protein